MGVKLSVTNISNGVRQVAFATHQSTKLEENISTLFGAKFLSSLLSFEFRVDEDSLNSVVEEVEDEGDNIEESGQSSDHEVKDNDKNDKDVPSSSNVEFKATVKGFISRVGVGVGRSDNDRQFVFCNGRPVDMPKIVKAFNEVWRRYEMKQKPAFILDLKVSAGSFDVNLAPDKREVIVQNENLIVDKLREIIDELYSPSRHTFAVAKPSAITPYLQSREDIESDSPAGAMFQTNICTQMDNSISSSVSLTNHSFEVSQYVENQEDEDNTSLPVPATVTERSPPPIIAPIQSPMPSNKVVWMSPLEKERFTLFKPDVIESSQPVLSQMHVIDHESSDVSPTSPVQAIVKDHVQEEHASSESMEIDENVVIGTPKESFQLRWKNSGVVGGDGLLSYLTGRKRRLQCLYGIGDKISSFDPTKVKDMNCNNEGGEIFARTDNSALFNADQFKTLTKSVGCVRSQDYWI